MIYVRGNPGDYHYWAQNGATEWDYRNVLPYFQRMETSHGFQSAFRGDNGPLQVSRGKRDNPLHSAIVKASEEAGYKSTEDYNGHRQEGFGPADMTVWKGSRSSAAKAYLRHALEKKNVQLLTGALVEKIIFENKKAVGVQFSHQGQSKIIKVKKKEIRDIAKLIGSDVILGLNSMNSILTAKNELKLFKKRNRFYTLIVKPNFGCSTREIYSKVRKFEKPKLNNPNKKMFNFEYLKRMNNSLEPIAFSKYSKLKVIKLFLENLSNSGFVRMTGSGSALVAYFQSKEKCENVKRQFIKKYKNYWCKASKTI